MQPTLFQQGGLASKRLTGDELLPWRRISAGLASLNAQSEQATLKRLHLAFRTSSGG